MIILVLVATLLMPSLVQAAYVDEGVILRHDFIPNTPGKFVVRFTGNAGEPVVDRDYYVAPVATPALAFQLLRTWIRATVTELNLARAAVTAAQVQPGAVVTGLAPSATTPPLKSVWLDKVSRYHQLCTLGFVGTTATACAALKTDIEATYLNGYLNE